MRCPDGAALAAWVDGEVVGPPAAAVESHVARCVRCARAARAERQVKWRTVSLRAEAGAVRPAPDLLSVLMTVPQAERDRAVRRAHQARCGDGHHDAASGRLRGAAIGAGAAVWLVAAVWSSPAGLPSNGVASSDVASAAAADTAQPSASVDVAPAVADTAPAAPVVAAGFSPVGLASALVPAGPVPTALVSMVPLSHGLGVGESAISTAPAVPPGQSLGFDPASVRVIAGR